MTWSRTAVCKSSSSLGRGSSKVPVLHDLRNKEYCESIFEGTKVWVFSLWLISTWIVSWTILLTAHVLIIYLLNTWFMNSQPWIIGHYVRVHQRNWVVQNLNWQHKTCKTKSEYKKIVIILGIPIQYIIVTVHLSMSSGLRGLRVRACGVLMVKILNKCTC